jgi:hypothetical protein
MDGRAMMGRIAVTLPPAAQVKFNLLDVARMVSEDAARSVTSRLSNMPRDADPRAQLERERDRHSSRHRAISGLLHKVNEWLMRLHPNTVLEVVPAEDIKLRDGETWVDAIEATRNEITALQGQLQVIRAAPLPVEDQIKCVAEYVEKTARLARPAVSIVKDGAVRVAFKDVFVEPEQVLSLLAWIDPEKVRDALTGVLEAQPRVLGAMTASEKQQRMAELEAKLLELERQEEALIELAAKQGLDVLRRVDIVNLGVVLGVMVVAKAKAQVPMARVIA